VRVPPILLCFALAACVGELHGPIPSAPPPPSACDEVEARVGQWPLQRLTSRQLTLSVQAVLGDGTGAYQRRLGATDEVVDSRLRYFVAWSGNTVVAEGLVLAAEEVADAAVLSPALASARACAASDAAGQRACADQFVATFGHRLWRRTLSNDEREGVLGVYDLARSEGDHTAGLQAALHALLASPDFFFLQQPTSGARLSGTVLAERLSLTLWQQGPDDELLTAAETGALETEEGLNAQLDRLLADPRANLAFADFLKHWLSPEKTSSVELALASATRSSGYPLFHPPSGTSAGDGVAFTEALDAWLARTATLQGGDVHTLMLDEHVVVNEAITRNLGLAAPNASLEVRESDTPRRRGVLGQPAVLAAFSRFEASDPVHRGVFLLRQGLCRPLNPPDAMVNTTLPDATAFKTTRDRFVSATKDSACAGCHAQINPLGFAFENFDAVGAFRAAEGVTPVDATAVIPLYDAQSRPRNVDGLGELAAVLADDPEVRACMSRHFAAWALHRGLTSSEYCALAPSVSGFREGGGDFRALVRGLITSASFLQPEAP
jgi:Protein of unknown function (DUF1588)/Protein of unknown function (DUF1592)/Protein of unknown function (DUF1595)/Protein of unknown function (DUF1585)